MPFNEIMFQPRVVSDQPKPVPLQAYFAAEQAPSSRNRIPGRRRPITAHVCRFGPDGRHTYRCTECPHISEAGWTVQG